MIAVLVLAALAALVLPVRGASSAGPGQALRILVPGVDARMLHRRLEQAGMNPGPYNPEDTAALAGVLARFQQARGLEPSGVLDQATWQALAPESNPEDRPAPQTELRPEIRPDIGPEQAAVPAWPDGLLAAARGWLCDLGFCPAGPGAWDQAADQGLRAFRQKQGLAQDGPLTPVDLSRLLSARFPSGCRLEITVWPAGARDDPEAAATPPQRKLELSVAQPGEIPQRVLDLLLPLAAPAGGNEETPRQADPATLWALLNTVCTPGCRFNLELKGPPAKPRPKKAPAPILEPAGRVKPERMDWEYQPKAGDQVLAVEKVECSAVSGDWVVFYRGQVSRVEPGKVMVKLAERLGYRHRPESAGINSGDWWCVPRRRHCWSVVKFGDWGGKRAKDQIVEFSPTAVFNGRIGVVNAMSALLGARCTRQESR